MILVRCCRGDVNQRPNGSRDSEAGSILDIIGIELGVMQDDGVVVHCEVRRHG
ncbi:hypothetical protein I549_0864 [Mycobacterium avium subsp. avium 2285 (R)]|nr:hypothetical protein L837_0020 [Mycobacterium avium MAV_061107_1842]EUA41178.1 hypothetical protein I549_0864 [Mycobacterium avium subsp. avium 2285 (R)]